MASLKARTNVRDIYKKLYVANGKQHWWPGNSAFEIMVGAVLTQNTSWTNVKKAIVSLKRNRVLSPQAIVKTHPRRLARWLKPSGYFNIKARRLRAMCQWLIRQGGTRKIAELPTDEPRHHLLAVHGIGPEAADDILLYVINRPVFVIDVYTRRIFARLGLIGGTEDYETLRHIFEDALDSNVGLFNEYHALVVVHGKDVCHQRPLCDRCCLAGDCPASDLPGSRIN